MPQTDPTLPPPTRKLRLVTLPQLADELGVSVRHARDWLALHPSIRTYQHARSTIRLISADDVEALLGSARSQDGTAAPIVTEPTSADDVLAAVGLRRRAGGAR